MNEMLTCVDCGKEFVFTEGEQKFYHDRVLAPPKRCHECRVAKRNEMRERKRERENERVLQSSQ